MSTKQYSIRGRFPARDGEQAFEKELEAPNESVAIEYVLSKMGSDHGLKRTQIHIDEVES